MWEENNFKYALKKYKPGWGWGTHYFLSLSLLTAPNEDNHVFFFFPRPPKKFFVEYWVVQSLAGMLQGGSWHYQVLQLLRPFFQEQNTTERI